MLSLHYLYSFHLLGIGNLPIAEICSNVHSLFIRSEASVINNHYQYKFSTHYFSYLSLMQMEINTHHLLLAFWWLFWYTQINT